MKKKVINEFKLKITQNGVSKGYGSTLYEDGTVDRKEIKNNV